MSHEERLLCSFREGEVACDRPARWAIAVGADLELTTCDEHRNACLMRYEAKDVCGIVPLNPGDFPGD